MKKVVKWIIIALFLLTLLHLLINQCYGPISYIDTLSTEYEKKDNTQIVKTRHFEIETPTDWIHIFNGYGIEGQAIGSFWTKAGIFTYEYGMFANPFCIDSISTFKRDSVVANRFLIYIGKNNYDEVGIHIPRQHEMEWEFSIFMNRACAENLDDIIYGVRNLKFKKFYNMDWKESDDLPNVII